VTPVDVAANAMDKDAEDSFMAYQLLLAAFLLLSSPFDVFQLFIII
jgi:hypothetical protein